LLEPVGFPELCHAHRATAAVDQLGAGHADLLPQPGKLSEARDEDSRHAARTRRIERLVEHGEVDAGPEAVLELVGGGPRLVQHAALAENDRPRHDRGADQQRHDQLDDDARVQHERQQRMLADHVSNNPRLPPARSAAGGRMPKWR
jgi:hypothetical protein